MTIVDLLDPDNAGAGPAAAREELTPDLVRLRNQLAQDFDAWRLQGC